MIDLESKLKAIDSHYRVKYLGELSGPDATSGLPTNPVTNEDIHYWDSFEVSKDLWALEDENVVKAVATSFGGRYRLFKDNANGITIDIEKV